MEGTAPGESHQGRKAKSLEMRMVSSGMGGDISGKALLPAAFIHLKDPFRFRGLPVDDVHMGTCVWQGWPNGAGQMGEMSKSLDRETGIVAAWGGEFSPKRNY